MTDVSSTAGALGVPAVVRLELDRIAARWAQLPLAAAESRMPRMRRTLTRLAHLAELAQRAAASEGGGGALPDLSEGPEAAEGPMGPEVPDLGPAVVIDQLRVLVWDATSCATRTESAHQGARNVRVAQEVADELVALRHDLA